MKNLVQIFEDAADTLSYKFLYGAKAFINYDVSDTDLTNGAILIALFPLIDSGLDIPNGAKISSLSTATTIWFGRKFDTVDETGTQSELDETNRQKYDRRLYAMKVLLIAYIEAAICGTDIEILSFRMTEAINKTAENIDFISCDLTLRNEV